ncbi:MAG: hypothetical protein H6604_03600 [Flavobacteriales bacterium]|nr:hypothetical protein [Flavobacteriales bacterium]
MSAIDDFVVSVKDFWEKEYSFHNEYCIGEKVKFDLENSKPNDVVLLGFLDSSDNSTQSSEIIDLKEVRTQLYKLSNINWEFNFIDLGDIFPGNTFNDSLVALEEVVKEVLEHKVKLIVLGGNGVINYNLYTILSEKELINYTQISPNIGLSDYRNKIKESNFITKILLSQTCKLAQYNSIASQNFLNPPSYRELVEKLNFELLSLGDINADVLECEPIIRTSDFINFDLNAIQYSGYTFSTNPQPNGLTTIQACSLLRYAGASEKNKIVHLSNYQNNQNPISSKFLSQLVWHILDGNDLCLHIIRNISKVTKHIVMLENSEIIFYNEKFSNRWWMQFSIDENMCNGYTIPCSEKDYHSARVGEIPKRYWKAYKKIL